MGSAAKSPNNGKKSSINTEAVNSEQDEQFNDETTKNPTELFDKNFIQALDSPIPIVIPPHECRYLRIKYFGTEELEFQAKILDVEANSIDACFLLDPAEGTVKSNEIFSLKITYSPNENKFKPTLEQTAKSAGDASKQSKSNDKESVSPSDQKRHALIEVTTGDNQCCYLYPVLGSSDKKDEERATEKRISMKVESDEKNKNLNTTNKNVNDNNPEIIQSKRTRDLEQVLQNNQDKRRKKGPGESNSTCLEIKAEPDDIEIKEEPIDLP